MRVGVIGAGYVGLVTGTCFAEMGNDVICMDNNPDKIAQMQAGEVPIFEPGLKELFDRNIKEGRLKFTTDINETLGSAAIFLALPTPPGEDGSADLSYILGTADRLGEILTDYTVIVDKSTVPVGTAEKVRERIAQNAKTEFDVVSNPEFLREGQAVADFMKPDRVVIGTSSERAAKVMRRLYKPVLRQQPGKLIVTDEASAEMIKYAANGFLATKISFINELSGLCEEVGADIEMVRQGMGSDGRIGPQFLYPGPGYGGSCFPKDTLALEKTGEEYGFELGIVRAAREANERQKQVIPNKILTYFDGDVEGKTFALWGLAFKDNTDDVRESPALEIITALTAKGARIVAYDPEAIGTTKAAFKRDGFTHVDKVAYATNEYKALDGADGLIIATNWKEFFDPNFDELKAKLKAPIIFDGRNLYDLDAMKEQGFTYVSIGRKSIHADEA